VSPLELSSQELRPSSDGHVCRKRQGSENRLLAEPRLLREATKYANRSGFTVWKAANRNEMRCEENNLPLADVEKYPESGFCSAWAGRLPVPPIIGADQSAPTLNFESGPDSGDMP
jgi:hypothetical protein